MVCLSPALLSLLKSLLVLPLPPRPGDSLLLPLKGQAQAVYLQHASSFSRSFLYPKVEEAFFEVNLDLKRALIQVNGFVECLLQGFQTR